ncbi:S1 RNA-binding domain-containing protein [Olleya namhaensis]|uniref:S1 RNA binding domain-containing protein n=1 Tax=Olleya namhaensis TaxID=1144750 RepID=A0A1I3MS91_9FLAO|nr:S1 RNA-binding domain-containing protein [Olleya namhaensis]SFI99847.1 S1 RNA binding domain-containing protein [Olleya namhaensis]
MDSKRELQDRAKLLIETNPSGAADLYLTMWKDYREDFNNYDAVALLQALRKTNRKDVIELPLIVEKFKDYEIVSSLCGWYVFNSFIKHKTPQDILNSENSICNYINIIKQKDISVDDNYPCPFSIILFKLIEAHSKNLFNANKIYEYCKKINPDFLSKKTSEFKDKEGKTKQNPSDIETYYQYYTKVCDKLNKSEEAIDACEKGLKAVSEYHYDNDLWFQMRIARAHRNLKDYESSEKKYLELINTRAGSTKYFLFEEYSGLLNDQERYKESWIQSLRAGIQLYDVQYSAKLLLHQSRLLARLDRIDDAKKFAEIIFLGIQENLWNNSTEYQKLINYFEIKELKGKSDKFFKDLYKTFKDELYFDSEINKGEIVFIHPRGKLGRIRFSNNESINFSKSSFNNRVRNLDKFNGAKVSFVIDYDYKSEQIAENIKIENLEVAKVLVGLTSKGKIRNIVDFGLFIDMENGKTGLAHISTLPKDFQEIYEVGNVVKVRVEKETEKGLSLKIVD